MSEGNLTIQYPGLEQNVPSAPSAPEYEQADDKRKYYKNLSRSYKDDNHDLLKKNKKLKNENEKLQENFELYKKIYDEQLSNCKKEIKKINTDLLQEMENNAILESKLVLSNRKYDKVKKRVRKQDKEHLQYCYIQKKIKPRKRGCLFG
jgi:hypothetical protein